MTFGNGVRWVPSNKSGVGVGRGVFVAVGVSEGIGVIVEEGVSEGGRVGERVAWIPTEGDGLDIGTACSSMALPQLVMIIDSNKTYFTLVMRIFISFLAYTDFGFDLPKMR
ncbi:MAG: hypothetical protein KAT23_02720 [Anaerolineales bacterium]|nr:hypothetical protein [Anaerolineales bacterium]